MRQRTSAQVRNQSANQSVYGYAVGAAVLPAGAYPDLHVAARSPRGVLMAVVDAHGDVATGQRIADRIAQVYEAIPPDVDRLIALRATLDQARQAMPHKPRRGAVAMLLAVITEGRCYGIAEGSVCGYHALADGQLIPCAWGQPANASWRQRPDFDLHAGSEPVNERLRHRAGAVCAQPGACRAALNRVRRATRPAERPGCGRLWTASVADHHPAWPAFTIDPCSPGGTTTLP
jgi:hypothetical protein